MTGLLGPVGEDQIRQPVLVEISRRHAAGRHRGQFQAALGAVALAGSPVDE